jgi:hypothetical protein
LRENILPIQESGQLHFVDTHGGFTPGVGAAPATISDVILPGLSVRLAEGHTAAMMLPQLSYRGRTLVFVADLLPSIAHFPMPWTMAYDMFPLTSMVEKRAFLDEAAAGGYVLFFEHDPVNECCVAEAGEKGVRPGKGFSLTAI